MHEKKPGLLRALLKQNNFGINSLSVLRVLPEAHW